MTVQASDINVAIEALLDRTQFLYQRWLEGSKFQQLLPVHVATISTVGDEYRNQLWGFGLGIVNGADNNLYYPWLADSGTTWATDYGCNVCASTIGLIAGTGAATTIRFFVDYHEGAIGGNAIDEVQIVGTDYSPGLVDTLTCARSDVFSDGETVPHYTTGVWIAENWASSGFSGNLHELTYNEDYPPTWTLAARTSPFGGVGGDDREWQVDGIMAHYTATPGANGELIAIGQPVASGSWYVNVSTDKGATWAGRSALSLDSGARPLLLEFTTAFDATNGDWVLVDSYGHIWFCSGDVSSATGSNWVKQDAVAAGTKVVDRDYISSCVLLGTKFIFGVFDDGAYQWEATVCMTDDFWASYPQCESGWGWVGKRGQWLVYTTVGADTTQYVGISLPIADEVRPDPKYVTP